MPDRLLIDLGEEGQAKVLSWPDGGLPEEVSRVPLAWPLDADALEDLRWYLEDYLLAPYGVWEDRGPAVREKLSDWGNLIFGSVFGAGPARDAYQRARDRGLEVVFRSAAPGLLGLPRELMRDGPDPVAMGAGGISRSLPVSGGVGTLEVPGGKLRVLMVISRPAGVADVGCQIVARPLLERLEAVRGEVSLTVLRPPAFDALGAAVRLAADAGEPFHVVHSDGHGAMPGRVTVGRSTAGRPARMTNQGEGVLAFEKPGGGSDLVGASKVAAVLSEGKIPVVVLNACQSGAVGKELEASVATALLKAGCAAVVAMAYSVYAVAAAEFMAAFYESLSAGASVGQAVTAGPKRLFEHDGRPSPKGDMPLADWLIPVRYLRREVLFPQARTSRPAAEPSLDEALDQIRATPSQAVTAQDPLAAVGGVLVGRDDLFYQLETAARLQRVVVLTGQGGTGKTELAKGSARWWRATGGVSDPRLVFWHSFEPGVASFGLDGVITALGLAAFGVDFARLTPPQRLAQVKSLLGQLRVLLTWDNFEPAREMPDPARTTPPLDDAGWAALKGLLEWVRDHSSSVVLITSRAQEAWLGQVRRIGVGGLNRAGAARYADRLLAPYPAAQQRREHRSFEDLLEWLNGHPLAMRLTLPSLETTEPAALLAALRGTIPLSPEGTSDTGRATSPAASITYSYDHLKEQTRQLLPAASLFHGNADELILTLFSAEETVPARFAGVSEDEWLAVLGGASRVGLLADTGAGMYLIHPALPGYLTARWRAQNPDGYDQERQACERASHAVCATFSRWLTGQVASGDAQVALAVIELQRRTFEAMLGHALDRSAWDDAEAIVKALEAYWDTHGLGAEAAAWADRILDATVGSGQTPPEPASPLWLHTTITQGNRQLQAGQLDRAVQTYRRVLTYLQGQPATDMTRGTTAVMHYQIGVTARHRGRLDEAEEWHRKALATHEDLGSRPHVAGSYHQLSLVAQDRGRLDEAEEWHRKALATHEDLGSRPHMAITYHQLGRAARDGGRLEEARERHLKSLTIREDLGDRPGMAASYRQLGMTARSRGRLDEAEEWHRKALATYEELGDRPHMAITYHQLGVIARDRGRLEEAEEWYRKSLTIREDPGDRTGMALTYVELSTVAVLRRHLDEAEDWCRKALALDEGLGDEPKSAMIYGRLGLLAEARQQPRGALEWVVRCVALFRQFPHPAPGPSPSQLARLTRQLGMPALVETWRQVTGQPLPQSVLDYLTSQHDQ